MTNEEAIVVLTLHKENWERLIREHIAEQQEGNEMVEACALAIEALRENDKIRNEQKNEALFRAKLIDEWFDEGYNKAKETILGSMRDISTLDEAIHFFGKGEDFAQWRNWLSELKELREADNETDN